MDTILSDEKKEAPVKSSAERLLLIDCIRGFTLINMIIYHGMWDIKYLFGIDIPYFGKLPSYIYQQLICCTFILLSGFCVNLGKRKLRRGLTVLCAGFIIELVTAVFTPQSRIIFGILTFMGTAMLIMIPIERLLKKLSAAVISTASLILFIVTRNINNGIIGFEGLLSARLPDALYKGYAATFLGFTDRTFTSADYFSVFPWIFLFIFGYSAGKMLLSSNTAVNIMAKANCPPLGFIGRHSLIIYMLHQPVVYGILTVIFTLIR